jgi:hypothetical protein
MNRKAHAVIALLLLLIPFLSNAQELMGISNSNFAGNMGIFMNPSSIVMAPYKSEFNILSGDIFLDNNYIYLKKNSQAVVKTITGEVVPSERFGDYYTVIAKRGYASGWLMGPAYIKNNNNQAWGLHVAVKTAASVNDLPYHIAKFGYEGFDYELQHNVNYTTGLFKSAGLGWAEIGGTYARVLTKNPNDKHIIKAGISLNYLVGSFGIYANPESIEYMVPDAHTLIVNNLTATYGHSSPIDGEHLFNDLMKIRGRGVSASLGFTYINNLNHAGYDCYESADSEKKYNYMMGVSLIDFGYIHFSSEDTRTFAYENNSTYWAGIDSTKLTNLFSFDTLLSNRFYGSPLASQSGKEFRVYLPSAASLQFDYCIAPKYYANATIIQRVPVADIRVQRPNQAAVSLRYETRRTEVALPLTFFEYSKPHLGLAVRYGMLMLGTDRLGTYLGLWDATGIDFFFGIKFSRCESGKGKGKRRSKTGCDI